MNDLRHIIEAYNANAPLEAAATIPSAWYTDPRIAELERRYVFGGTWQLIARVDQLKNNGQYVTADIAGEPIVVVRGADGVLRGFFNVCRHHAAEVANKPEGTCSTLRCPYHGWTYALDGSLKGAPEFDGVCDFDKSKNGLVPVRVETWESFVFACLSTDTPPLVSVLGELVAIIAGQNLAALRFVERKSYDLACNWKVFVDNYLDGGYHVPHIHKGLGSILSYQDYKIENGEHYCRQASPIDSGGGEAQTAAVRGGDMAYYDWIYPNLMVNWYEGYMDTNLVLPLSVDRCRVIFDFYFADSGSEADAHRASSIAVAHRIQQEDIDVCESVQRGLQSRAYDVGRLSVRREAGEHLFHRLLYRDLIRAI